MTLPACQRSKWSCRLISTLLQSPFTPMTDLGWSIADVRLPLTGARRGCPFLRAGKNHLWDGAAKDKQWRPRLAQARWKTPTLYYTAIGCTVAVDECDGDVWFWSPERKTLCADISCARSRKYKPQQKRIRCSDRRRFKPQRRRGLQFPLLQCLRLSCFTLESPAKVIPNPPTPTTPVLRQMHTAPEKSTPYLLASLGVW